ncbi:MAG: hypothetical protein ACQEWW_16875 [Bacillota bacterium]
MANRKQKLRKKHKRQLMKRMAKITAVKPAAKHAAIVEVVEPAIKPAVKIGPNIEAGKYAEQNKLYNMALDKQYNGTVTALEKYINQRASLLHHCSNCGIQFYGKPKFMLGNDHQKHICTLPYGDSFGNRFAYVGNSKQTHKKKKGKKINGVELAKELDELITQKVNPLQIRSKTGVDLQIIKYYKETLYKEKTTLSPEKISEKLAKFFSEESAI